MEKIEKILIEKFPAIICLFGIFWIGLVVYGLLNQ